MRIIGKRSSGEVAVYEIYGFRYWAGEDGERAIYCIMSESTMVKITATYESISEDQNERYALQIFNTGSLNLLYEPVVLDIEESSIPVSISDIDYEVGLPVYVSGMEYEDGLPVYINK
ncbi:MAG: hypothetical protein Q8930_15185 [Bacillota bacterium]|nr:hypothetical protein [Bacillota bacterium]